MSGFSARWISEVRRGNKELRNERRPGRPHRHKTNAAIGSILEEDSNASLRTMEETLLISPETVHTYLSRICCAMQAIPWITHARACELKQFHLSIYLQLFSKLPGHAHNHWRHLVMRDKSQFYYEYVRNRIWTARDENAPEVADRTMRPEKYVDSFMESLWMISPSLSFSLVLVECEAKHEVTTKTKTNIQSKSFMFIMIWNPHEFHAINRLPNGATINGPY
jgi:hypothetical protein